MTRSLRPATPTPSNISTIYSAESEALSNRNLVLCFDGTTNKFGADRLINVVRMFELLQKDSQRQICYYQPGIGTYDGKVPLQEQTTSLSSKLSMIADAAFANGIRKHILGGYRFLMTHYRLGDQIYMFGFSRGAYTARALCGMLEKVGLLSYGNDEQVAFAWKMYGRKGNEDLATKFRHVFCQTIQIHFLGLWETVVSTRQVFLDPQTESFISYVYHALALDERRINFPPHLYSAPTRERTDKNRRPTQIFERWFVGNHSDVGGRFPFQKLDGDALANPSFRCIVWGAAHAGANIKRPLLFNLLAFTKYFHILVYTKDDPTVSSERKSITVDYFRKHSPTDDSEAGIIDPVSGRPVLEVRSTMQKVNNALADLSIWRLAQLLRGKSLRGNARRIDSDCILHASVKGRTNADELYGGKRREELLAAKSDEAIAKLEESKPRSRSLAARQIIGTAAAGAGSRSIATDNNPPSSSPSRSRSFDTSFGMAGASEVEVAEVRFGWLATDDRIPSSGPLSLRVNIRPASPTSLNSDEVSDGVSPLSRSPDDVYDRLPIPPASPQDRRGHSRPQSRP